MTRYQKKAIILACQLAMNAIAAKNTDDNLGGQIDEAAAYRGIIRATKSVLMNNAPDRFVWDTISDMAQGVLPK